MWGGLATITMYSYKKFIKEVIIFLEKLKCQVSVALFDNHNFLWVRTALLISFSFLGSTSWHPATSYWLLSIKIPPAGWHAFVNLIQKATSKLPSDRRWENLVEYWQQCLRLDPVNSMRALTQFSLAHCQEPDRTLGLRERLRQLEGNWLTLT